MSNFTALKVKEVHSGVLHKVGGRVKTWHKRWMVLNSDHMLHYYKDASKPSLGAISIADPVFTIRTGEAGDTSWPKQCVIENTLVVTTSGRTYYMFAESKKEAEGWITAISKARELCGTASTNSLPDRYNKMGGRAADLSTPAAVSTSPRKTPKHYKKKDRRLPTKKFNSVTGAEDLSGESENEDDEEFSDGQLSRQIPSSVPVFSTPMEGLYDLATMTDDPKPPPKSPAHLIPPPSSSSGRRDRSKSQASLEEGRTLQDSVCVNESLYDLVGRINAGEDIESQQQQDLYEPISEPTTSLTTTTARNSFLPPLPPPYNNNNKKNSQQEQFYDSVTEHFPDETSATAAGAVMYEDVERLDTLGEAESSDDDTVPLPYNDSNLSSPPPPLPPRVGEEMYDNAPSLPPKGTAAVNNNEEDLEEAEGYYGNASTAAPPRPVPSPIQLNSEPKRPKPLPRSNMNQSTPPSSPNTNNHNRVSNNGSSVPFSPYNEEPEQELYDDIQVVLKKDTTTTNTVNESEGMNGHNIEEIEDKIVTNTTPNKDNRDNTVDSTLFILRSNQSPDDGNTKRFHSATVGSADTGIEMFYRKAKELSCTTEEDNSISKQVKDLFLAEKKEAILSSEDKVVLAETLREIETEKQMASEEKFKWERERLKFEEERRQFEREKQQLLDELAKAKAQLETQK